VQSLLPSFFDELTKISMSAQRLRVGKTRSGKRPLSVSTLLKKEKDGSIYKFSRALKTAEQGKAQWLEVPYTEGERSMQNVPVRGKRKPGDAPVADGSENYYASRMNPTWQPQETAMTSKSAASLHPLVKSTTDTHPDRGSDGVPIRLFRARGTGARVAETSPDPQPITGVESNNVYDRN
jgi:hypothetical protein